MTLNRSLWIRCPYACSISCCPVLLLTFLYRCEVHSRMQNQFGDKLSTLDPQQI